MRITNECRQRLIVSRVAKSGGVERGAGVGWSEVDERVGDRKEKKIRKEKVRPI